MNLVSNPYLRGLAVSFVLACLMGLVAGTAFFFTPIKEYHLPLVANIIAMASVFIGAAYAAFVRGRKGLATGFTVGLIFWAILFFSSLLLFHFPIAAGNLLKEFLLIASSGVLGGILGVSLQA